MQKVYLFLFNSRALFTHTEADNGAVRHVFHFNMLSVLHISTYQQVICVHFIIQLFTIILYTMCTSGYMGRYSK